MAFYFWNIIYANCLGNHFTFLDASDFHSWFYLPYVPVSHSWENTICLKLIIMIFVNIYMSLASFPLFDPFSFKPMTWFILRPLTELPQFIQVGIYAQSKDRLLFWPLLLLHSCENVRRFRCELSHHHCFHGDRCTLPVIWMLFFVMAEILLKFKILF